MQILTRKIRDFRKIKFMNKFFKDFKMIKEFKFLNK